jgi:predicted nucleic acid-binding protein
LAAGLRVTGVLGLLGLAKHRQVILAVKPYIERAVAAGIRYDPDLIQRVLEEVGE